ncbi:hypothetical protein D3C84_1145450 [compost metagenome]
MNVSTQCCCHCCELQADETRANHHHVARGFRQRCQGIGIGFGLDAEYLRQLTAWHRQRAVVRPGGQDQMVITDCITAG